MLKSTTPGPAGATGATGATGPQGPSGPSSVGTPNSRTLSLSTAYQATNTGLPALVTVNLSCPLGGAAQIVIGATSAVASGTGTIVSSLVSSLTGTLLGGSTTNPVCLPLPAGWFFAVIGVSGAVSIASAFDQSVG